MYYKSRVAVINFVLRRLIMFAFFLPFREKNIPRLLYFVKQKVLL